MKTLRNFTLGSLFGAGLYFWTKHYDPPVNGITDQQQKLIDNYVAENDLQTTDRINLGKAFSLLQKKIYYHGLFNVLDGYKFHQVYLTKKQDQEGKIKHVYCIFSPNESLCWHPETLHGGISAMMIDQMSGLLSFLHSNGPTATAEFNLHYKKPVQIDQIYILESQLVRRQGRIIEIQSKIINLESKEVALASDLMFKTVDWKGHKSGSIFFAMDDAFKAINAEKNRESANQTV